MWRRILAYILFALGFLTITFFRRYRGEVIPHPYLFWLFGIVLFLGGLLFLRFTPTAKELSLNKKVIEMIEDLKMYGEKIVVDFANCEIKENNYTEEKEKYGHENELLTFDVERQIQIWNAAGGSSGSNVEQVQVRQSLIVFKNENTKTGTIEKFVSRVIPKDKISLSFYLDKQKHTTLYVDNTNRERYYFDLGFLDE